jgi:hypothetical protein
MNQESTWESKSYFGLILLGAIASLTLVLFSPSQAFAQEVQVTKIDSDFTVVAGEELKKNPTAIQILQNIELAKKRLAEMQNVEKQKTEREKFIDEQRRIAKELLEKDLNRMNKDYEDFTPKNAFARFVSGFNSTHHAIYWDQFEYLNQKIKIATQAKESVLANGGSYVEAQAEFIKYASMPRVEMISFVSDLNIKYGFTDDALQQYFDENGKLPRYENDDVAVCYACDKYEQIKVGMLEEHERSKSEST